jgi:hypothetical protein
MCHLKSLIFDCISFTEGLITSLSTADSEAPASNRTFVNSVFPPHAAVCRGVLPSNNQYKTIFNHKQFLIKSSQTTQLYTTKVFYKQFSCHHHIKKSFFVTNLVKINIFGFSSITRLEQDLIRCF